MCGSKVKRELGEARRFTITRADLKTLRAGLHEARILAKAARKAWPEVERIEGLIDSAWGRVENIRARTRYGPRKK
jgi:hypothetical protein